VGALRDHGKRGAVGRCLLDLLHCEAAARAGLEFDDDFLADVFGHGLRHDGGDELGGGAFAEGHHEGDRPVGNGSRVQRRADQTRKQAAHDRRSESVVHEATGLQGLRFGAEPSMQQQAR